MMQWVLELQIEFISFANSNKYGIGRLEHQVQRLLNLRPRLAGTRIVIDSVIDSYCLQSYSGIGRVRKEGRSKVSNLE